MSTITMQKMRAVKTISGNSPQILSFPEAASQTFVRGEIVCLINGKVTEIANDTPGSVLGVAVQDASKVADTMIQVAIANSDTIFEANYSNDSQAGAVTAVTIVGTKRDLDRDTGKSKVYVSSAQASVRVMIMDISENDTVGDTGGRVLFQFLSAIRALSSTS